MSRSTGPGPSTRSDARHGPTIALTLVLMVAAGLRWLGITHGLPFTYAADETLVVHRALALGNGDLSPDGLPGPPGYLYLLFVEYGLLFLAGKVAGVFASVDDFVALFVNHRALFYVAGRVTTALFGIATVYLTWAITRTLLAEPARRSAPQSVLPQLPELWPPLVAAGLMAVSLTPVAASQQVSPHVPAAFFVTLGLYFLLVSIGRHGGAQDLAAAGFWSGIGMGTAYLAAPVIPLFWLARVRFGEGLRGWVAPLLQRAPMGALILFVGGFVLVSPHAWSALPEVAQAQLRPTVASLPVWMGQWVHTLPTLLPALVQAVRDLMEPAGMGPLNGLMAAGGLLVLARMGTLGWVLIGYVVLMMFGGVVAALLGVGTPPRMWVLPALYAAQGVFLAAAGRWLVGICGATLSHLPARRIAATMLGIALVAPPASATVLEGMKQSRTDTRTLAAEWIADHVPADSAVVLDADGPSVRLNHASLRRKLAQAVALPTGPYARHARTYYQYLLIHQTGPAFAVTRIAHSAVAPSAHPTGASYGSMAPADVPRNAAHLTHILDRQVHYVVLNEAVRARAMSATGADRAPALRAFYRTVMERGHVLATFDPTDGNRPGPGITVLRVDPQDSGIASGSAHT